MSHCCWNQVPVPLGMPSMSGIWPVKHLHADAGEEADEDRRTQEVAEEAEPEDPRDDQQEAAHERDDAAVGEPLLRTGRHARDRRGTQPCGQQRRRRGVGTHDEQPRRAQEDEEHRREDDGVEAGHDGRLRDRRVAHALGDRDRGEGGASDDVAAQPLLLVAAHPWRNDPCGGAGHHGLPGSENPRTLLPDQVARPHLFRTSPGEFGSGQVRMLMARAITRVARASESSDSTTTSALAHGFTAETSVGLNAVAVANEKAR